MTTAAIALGYTLPSAAQVGPNEGGASSSNGEASIVRPSSSEESPGIVIRDDLNPNLLPPAGILDVGVNGVGQMLVRGNPATTGLGLCTGTLINPRTVIFAAHCVNTRPAEAYGPNGIANGLQPNGTPIAFAFEANTLPAVRQWLGLDGGVAGATNLSRSLYNVEQVWYDPRSLTSPGSAGFIVADVAIATLDTPAFDVPTWAMLFSPLDGPTHAIITGYGNAGRQNQTAAGTAGGIAIDFRRRAAENMISVLGSLSDRDEFLFGSGSVLQNNLYMGSFSDPNPAYNPAAGKFDFGIFGDTALAREGTTAGGDSGGPLIADQRYDRPVVVGVLSGGSRFFGTQQFHNYGSHSFYQPLHLYWDLIVANNPYVYATTKGGDGAWENAGHWVQMMDPSYLTDVDGQLVNDLPDTPAQGISPGGAKFGKVCFLTDCTTLSGQEAEGSGTPIFIAGGPGSLNFVPNNVVANPKAGLRSRYYDVTLAAAGNTTLSSAVTIDRMTLNGLTKLTVNIGGSLNVLGEFNQMQGWTQADGLVRSGGDMLFLNGLVSGSGTLRAQFVTVVGAIVAPGGADTVNTLTVNGDMIMASASSLFIDAGRAGADKLAVTGTLALNGGSIVFNKAPGAAPRDGQSFTIATSGAGIDGAFSTVYSFQGVLRPELTYNVNDIVATLRAGSLVQIITGANPTELAFAKALDTLRAGSYNSLAGLYGSIDLMGSAQLASTLSALAPSMVSETNSLQERQSRVMLGAVTDRLSMLGTGSTGTMSVIGSPNAMFLAGTAGASGAAALPMGLSHGLMPNTSVGGLPEGMTGFVSGGNSINNSTVSGKSAGLMGGQRSSHASMGLEMEIADGLTLGTAVGYARGFSASGRLGQTDSKLSQMIAYGSYQLGGGAYVAALAAAESGNADLRRTASTGQATIDLYGASRSERYSAMAETGFNIFMGSDFTLTPRASLSYASLQFGGFSESGGELALELDDLKLRRLESRLGFKIGGAKKLAAGWAFAPRFQADYVSNLGGNGNAMRVRFANAPDYSFVLPMAGSDGSYTEVKGGLSLSNSNVSFGAGLETTQNRSGFKDDRAVVDFAFRF
ncbi:MAG: autotransporter domain-containing protein [Sphingorhabdus sp.]